MKILTITINCGPILLAVLVGKNDPTGQDRVDPRDRGKPPAGKSKAEDGSEGQNYFVAEIRVVWAHDFCTNGLNRQKPFRSFSQTSRLQRATPSAIVYARIKRD
jgi:hypothetical protein